jgi:glycosyltransferase involved in cell wall biosynthesis
MKPKVTVVIPTFNRLDILPETVAALEQQDVHKGFFELLIIDDGSTDNTWSYLGQYAATTALPLNLRRQTSLGPAAARNWGIEQGQGELVIFLDADVIAEKGLVRKHWQRFENHRHKRCGWMGRIKPHDHVDRWQTYRWDEFALEEEGGPTRPISWTRYRTPNSAWPINLLKDAGGFDSRFIVAEDRELAYRLAQTGAELFYDPGILASHHHLLTYAQLISKARQYGDCAAKWYYIHPDDRAGLAERLGLYVTELPPDLKKRYLLKRMLVNAVTVPFIKVWMNIMRRQKNGVADQALQQMYRYYVSTSFRSALKRYSR